MRCSPHSCFVLPHRASISAFSVLAWLCIVLASGTLHGQTTINWADGSSSGAFLTGANWVGGEVPVAEDFFEVNAAEEITVTLGGNHSAEGFRAGASNGVWTLNLGGNTLTLLATGTGGTTRSFSMPAAGNLRTLTLENGTLDANDVDFRGAQTSVIVAAGAVFETAGISIDTSALDVAGTLNASARVQTVNGGSVVVNGGTFSLTANAPVYAGAGGLTDESLVHFSNGATVNTSILIAGRDGSSSGTHQVGGKGLILIEGTGTTVDTQRLWLSGGSRSTVSTSDNNPSPEGIGTLHVLDGAAVETDYFEAYERSTIFIDNASLTVGNAVMGSLTGGRLHEGSTLQIGLNSVAQPTAMIVDVYDITSADLEIILASGFSANISDEFLLISYATSLVGEFKGYGEGALITVDDYTFELSYGSRDPGGNVSLTVIPEPRIAAAVFGLLALAFSLLLRRRITPGCKI